MRITLPYFPAHLQSCRRCYNEKHYRNLKQYGFRYTGIRLSLKCSNALSTVKVTDKRSNNTELDNFFFFGRYGFKKRAEHALANGAPDL